MQVGRNNKIYQTNFRADKQKDFARTRTYIITLQQKNPEPHMQLRIL